jgi:hypothetical protein
MSSPRVMNGAFRKSPGYRFCGGKLSVKSGASSLLFPAKTERLASVNAVGAEIAFV